MQEEYFDVKESDNGDLTIVLTSKKIDGITSNPIADSVINIISTKNDVSKLIFDMDIVTYVASAGLKMFTQVSNVCRKKGIDFEIINLSKTIHKIFLLTGYATVFDIRIKEDI